MNAEISPVTPPPAEVDSSRSLWIAVLASLLMLGIGLGLLLWNDVRQKSTEVQFGRRIVTEYQTNNEPRIREFVANLQAFAKTNPDFTPILVKYGLLQPAAPAPAAK